MAFADTASRKLLHGAGGTIARGVTANAIRMSFGLDGLWRLIAGLFGSAVHLLVLPFEALWQLIHGFFASLLAALGSAAHVFAVPFEAISQWLQTAAVSVSFGFDGLWQYMQGIFPNLLATLAGAAHKLLLPFEAFWRWIQTTIADAALPTVLLIAAVVCLVALVWFCGTSLCAAAVPVAQALGRCLHVVAMGLGRALAFLLPCCVSVTMNAPGAAGFVISRAAFVANPRLYFQILRSAGAVVASAVFCTTTVASAVAVPVAALFRF